MELSGVFCHPPPVPQQGRSTLESMETLNPRLLSSIILCLVLNNLLALSMRTPLKLLQTAKIYLILMRIARALPYMNTIKLLGTAMTSQIFIWTAKIYLLIWSENAKNCLSLKTVLLSVICKKKFKLIHV